MWFKGHIARNNGPKSHTADCSNEDTTAAVTSTTRKRSTAACMADPTDTGQKLLLELPPQLPITE